MAYDWKNQTSVVQQANGSFSPADLGTTIGTFSFITSNQKMLDDANSD
jgi:hypothetical protein